MARSVGRGLPKVLSQRIAIALLEAEGWTRTLGGKHTVKMEKEGELRPITLPHHHGKDYGPRLRSAILRQAGLVGSEQERSGDRER